MERTNDVAWTVTRRAWWIAIGALLSVLLLQRAVPRYDWRAAPAPRGALLRIDRWTGRTQLGVVSPSWGRWVSLEEMDRDAAVKRATPRAESRAESPSSGAAARTPGFRDDVTLRVQPSDAECTPAAIAAIYNTSPSGRINALAEVDAYLKENDCSLAGKITAKDHEAIEALRARIQQDAAVKRVASRSPAPKPIVVAALRKLTAAECTPAAIAAYAEPELRSIDCIIGYQRPSSK